MESNPEQAERISFGRIKKEDVALSSIEYSFAPKFHRYLTVTRVEKLGDAAAMKQIKNTKQIFGIAVSNNYITWMDKEI